MNRPARAVTCRSMRRSAKTGDSGDPPVAGLAGRRQRQPGIPLVRAKSDNRKAFWRRRLSVSRARTGATSSTPARR